MVGVVKPPYDYIVAADIVYNPEFFGALLDTLDKLMDEKTIMIMSHEKRSK